jgi:hypothetical protein
MRPAHFFEIMELSKIPLIRHLIIAKVMLRNVKKCQRLRIRQAMRRCSMHESTSIGIAAHYLRPAHLQKTAGNSASGVKGT